MKKVSIIVPIYNAEKFLNKCIDSLINQTYKNLEIILINDGSIDNSKSIVETYHDKRIVFIDKENTGVGSTRNLGIEKASGDYLMFVDSDDFIELNCVEKMLGKAEKDNCELVISNYYLDTKDKTYEIKFEPFEDTTLKENPNLLLNINLGPCNKIYHKNLFKENDNKFIVGLKYEDAPVVVQAVREAKKIGFINDYLFHYVIQKTGETITRDARVFDIISICSLIENKLKEVHYSKLSDLMVKILMPYLKNSRFIPNKEIRNEFIDAIFIYLKRIDKNWRKSEYLKKESKLKQIILTHKNLIKLVAITNR